jgi:hypothetical protein
MTSIAATAGSCLETAWMNLIAVGHLEKKFIVLW